MRVAIADDSALFRRGLVLLLAAAQVDVVLEARTGQELVTRMPTPLPDGVVLDIRMPPTFTEEGLATAEEIRKRWPTLPVLVLSSYGETTYASRLLSPDPAGRGYMLKDRVDTVEALVDALGRLSQQETVIDPMIITRLMEKPRAEKSLLSLTVRERAVLSLMAEGRSNGGIADELGVLSKTVENHVANIFAKLDIPAGPRENRRVLAVLTWLRHGGKGEGGIDL